MAIMISTGPEALNNLAVSAISAADSSARALKIYIVE
jgi:hypothetical protein